MSNRTVIEINHDYGNQIQANPDEFLEAIRNLINYSSTGEDVIDDLSRFGITVTPTVHHSDPRRVVLGNYYDKEL